MLHRVCARIGTEHGEACHRRIHGGGAGVNALRQCNGIGILHFFRRIPVCARMGIPQHRCNHKGNGELCVRHGSEALVRCPHSFKHWRIHNDLFNLLWADVIFMRQIIDNLCCCLYPHIGRPVLHQRFHNQIPSSKIPRQP